MENKVSACMSSQFISCSCYSWSTGSDDDAVCFLASHHLWHWHCGNLLQVLRAHLKSAEMAYSINAIKELNSFPANPNNVVPNQTKELPFSTFSTFFYVPINRICTVCMFAYVHAFCLWAPSAAIPCVLYKALRSAFIWGAIHRI